MGLLERLQSKNQNDVQTGNEQEPAPLLEAEKLQKPKQPAPESVKPATKQKKNNSEKTKANGDYQELKNLTFKHILKERKDEHIEVIVADLDSILSEILEANPNIAKGDYLERLKKELTNDLTGYGPINPLLLDDEVSEVMVNGPYQVYAERRGRLELTDITFRDNEHVMAVLEKIVSPLGRRIDESSPMVDARLSDGSRVNAIIPPLALGGPTITIRKFSKDPFTVNDLIRFGTLTQEMADFLEACVKAKLNMFVSGGTGSGKTTTLNVLSSFISNEDRIVTIEDAAELQLGQDHVVSLEARPPNIEEKGAITIRDLVRNSLRMRPDRIVIGEVRSGEALDMLQAMNTGHDGSLATGHANSPRDMLARLETMVLMAGMELPIKAIRDQIAGALDVIIQQSRLKDGSRRITNITEVQGLEGDIIVLQDIFVFQQSGVGPDGKIIGKLVPTGVRPKFYERMEREGIHLPASIFMEKGE
ncbi:CpaF family protein [Bacillus thermotolerans]|uniref:Type II/IV secretion system ATP hydrolase TadA/VirB11/CpaF, TadA subfamily n=1 Tax=Bacillus thermotolerans TaxID=1221996 RepID=A0A0F5HU92_BACTR|nr:CpaF family protein [Bacillus thermotolerans]KKB36813.1 Type II/IV secretion system ATP hydrolase TadA/VirB11/CpaF, TadA subfamily [Bacillus thermotolerans]KKB40440.1 Type II/IV secretion system ATP hydrolase TadA/VirB11/CpaF, TadA subfamily [Bacillus thermotolerans]